MRTTLVFLGLSLPLLLAGCSTPPEERLETPAARVEGLNVQSGASTLTLRLTNPNIVPLVINSSSHKLSLDNNPIGVIDEANPIGLPPGGQEVHSLKLPPKVAQAAQAYLRDHPGTVRITVKSGLSVATTADDSITLTSIGSGLIKNP
jgi:LEA14-like dessication related protein